MTICEGEAMIFKKTIEKTSIVFCAVLMAIAPGMDFSVQRKVFPDAADFWDSCYQIIARTADAFSTDRISLAVLLCLVVWLCHRYLFKKPKGTGIGEYLLCAFMSGMMVLNRAISLTGSVQLLYTNSFQIIKTLLYFVGIFLFFLMGLRGLNDLLRLLRKVPVTAPLQRIIDKQTSKSLYLWLAILWLPHVIIKYPGVLMWDTFNQIKQFIGDFPKQSNHPPFGTLLYGIMAKLGMMLGNINIGYFLFMLVQVGAFLAVLVHSLTLMKRLGVNSWIRLSAFILYSVSPCYIGWATVICKDTMYLILCMQIGVFLMEFAHDGLAFLQNTKKKIGLCACLLLLWLTRYNGAIIVAIVFGAIAVAILIQKAGRAYYARLGIFALATIILSVGCNEALLRILDIPKVYMYDTYSLPFQQTARVVKLHDEDIPRAEAEIIDRVLQYEEIGKNYGPWYADAVKDTYRAAATQADRIAYLKVWLKQLVRYPLDYVDALLNMNGLLFDLQRNRPMYISLSDSELTSYVYPYSYNDMSLYNHSEIASLNSVQRMLTQWYFSFDRLPLIGWFASMGFCMNIMLAMLYLAWINRRKKALWVFIPSIVTAFSCLFVPVVYLRYALPYVCALPLWFAAYDTAQPAKQPQMDHQVIHHLQKESTKAYE